MNFRCACMHCMMGLSNHCDGPDRARNHAEWNRKYSDACADFVLMLGLGVVPTEEARERLRARLKEIQPLLEG